MMNRYLPYKTLIALLLSALGVPLAYGQSSQSAAPTAEFLERMLSIDGINAYVSVEPGLLRLTIQNLSRRTAERVALRKDVRAITSARRIDQIELVDPKGMTFQYSIKHERLSPPDT